MRATNDRFSFGTRAQSCFVIENVQGTVTTNQNSMFQIHE